MNKLKVLDLFSGIGGFSLGLHRTGGFETVAFCEMKPHAQAVLAQNFPGVPCHADVTTYDFQPGEADVITAGFPCQDISFAGFGAGLAGARSGLYREVVRALRVVRPKFAVLENVAALLSRGLGTVLGDVAEVGYDAEWHCIPASAVGAPHRRDRIWIVAHARGEQHQGGCTPLSGPLSEELSRAFADNTSAPAGSGRQGYAQRSHANVSGPHRAEIDQLGSLELWDEQVSQLGPMGQEVADADSFDAQGILTGQPDPQERTRSVERQAGSRGDGFGQWAVEPRLGRVAHGVPNRVDRLEELGNAVVPQVPEIIGNAILQRMRAPL